ncbi:Gp15 family bacteriophage protein [Enterococcus sp. LJL128]
MGLSLAWGIDDTLEIDGQIFHLNLEFSSVLRWYEVFQDSSESDHFKVLLALILLGNQSEEELEVMSQKQKEILFIEILKRVFGEKESEDHLTRDLQGNILDSENEPTTKFYDLIEDTPYIYASFRQDYGINLLKERGKMHWDEFNALLAGLSEQTKMRKVIDIRTMKIPEKCSPDERQKILDAKKAVALKSSREAVAVEAMDLLERRRWYEEKQKRGEEK